MSEFAKTATSIPMGDGSYFDFLSPDASLMTLDDYAWGLAGNNRFRGQTREGGRRALYNVAQHCTLLCDAMLAAGCSSEQAYEGLMHESDEVHFGDFPAPLKPLLPPELILMIAGIGNEIDRHFGVTNKHKKLVKSFDVRMAATEQRDLLPLHCNDVWPDLVGIEPFDFTIYPIGGELSVFAFKSRFEMLRASIANRAKGQVETLAARPFVTDECTCCDCQGEPGMLVLCQVAA